MTPLSSAPASLQPTLSASTKYRPDIDGLRAIAVIAVVLYHLGINGITGGFVGVDVFFVISGFLITGIITSKLSANSFSIREFFTRRVRRLFPAMFATVGLTFVGAYFLLPPPDLEKFGLSSLYSTLSVSNIYFWSESGYFDSSAVSKPLLHTWSLGVEEQFYLVWPFLLVLSHRLLRARPAITVAITGIVSFIACQLLVESSPSTAFFWMPMRAYEFAIGGLIALAPAVALRKSVANLLSFFGLALLAYPVFFFSKSTTFPGWSALIPCIGTALVIFAIQQSSVRSALENKAMLWVGTRSYSIYLVHWPIIVLYSYYNLGSTSLEQKLILLAATLVLAQALYMLVEQPFRNGLIGRIPSALVRYSIPPTAIIAVCLVSYNASSSGGWAWRLPEELRVGIEDMMKQRMTYWATSLSSASRQPFTSSETTKVYFLGNSHAVDVYNAFNDIPGTEARINGTTGPQCFAFRIKVRLDTKFDCASTFAELSSAENAKKAEVIVISELWQMHIDPAVYVQELGESLRLIREQNPSARLVMVGPRMMFEGKPVYQRILEFGRLYNSEKYLSKFYQFSYEHTKNLSDKLSEFAQKNDITYIDTLAAMCQDSRCKVLTDDNKMIYWDTNHWTMSGSKYFKNLVSKKHNLSTIFDARTATSG